MVCIRSDAGQQSAALLEAHFRGESDYYECECRMRHKRGDWVWVLDRGQVLDRGPDGVPLLMFGTHADITETKALQDRIREVSIRDPLTGVYNRRHLFERLEALQAEYRRSEKTFAIAVIDLDHFKRLNDRHGHLAGDQVLRDVVRILGRSLRPYDLVARYGGEEFVMVFVNTTVEQAARRLERVLDSVRHRAFDFDGERMMVTFSAGVADCREIETASLTLDRLFELADRRLYDAKQAGRDRIRS